MKQQNRVWDRMQAVIDKLLGWLAATLSRKNLKVYYELCRKKYKKASRVWRDTYWKKISSSPLYDRLKEAYPHLKQAYKTRKYVRIIAHSMLALIIGIIAAMLVLPFPLFKDPYSRVLLDAKGELLAAKIAGDEQWRFPSPLSIPDKYEKAVLEFEDKRFYYHFGFDPWAITRAFYLNFKAGRIVSGGSTISMQVIRLSRHNRERTVVEKLVEIFLSVGLEALYSKKEILLLYAGHAPYGGNVVGLEAASWRYFGRTSEELSWAESCLLAVLPNSPSLLHPGRNRQTLKEKRDALLRRLWKSGAFDELEYKLACAEPLPVKPHPLPRQAGHLLETLDQRKDIHTEENAFYQSTIKRDVQQRVVSVMDAHAGKLALRGIYNAAAVVIDNTSAEVIAYIGNVKSGSDSQEEHLRRRETGSAIDILQRPRSTGSILKPLLYLAMLHDGEIFPETLVEDIPTQYNGYMPENYDRTYQGAVPAKMALARSLNVPAVRMLQHYGLQRYYHFLKQAGLTTLHRSADEYGLTLILGGAEATLWDLTTIYAQLARCAEGLDPLAVRLLRTEEQVSASFPPITAAEAYLTLQALLEVTRPGLEGYWRNFSSSRKIAWKTGTSYGLRDGWAIGSSPRYTVGVWVGNADGEGKAGLTGISVAAPILFDIFNMLDETGWFKAPYLDMKQVEICRQSGYLATELCEKKTIWVPKNSNFTKICPFHRLIHLDKQGKWQVTSRCVTTAEMQHKPWFVLPPVEEYYYRRQHADYRVLPPLREDCRKSSSGGQVMNLVYPSLQTKIYLPIGLDGKLTATVFKAVHRKPDTTVYWHLDDQYLGETRTFHHKTLQPSPGKHVLVLVDEDGNRLVRTFKVLGKE